MNKGRRGQTGILSYFAVLFTFLIIWAFWLGSFLSDWGEQAITSQGLTGIEAFFFANINLFVLFGILISAFAILRFGATTNGL